MFRRVFLAAILAGLAAGLLVTALQAAKLTPLITAAEFYETAAMSPAAHEDVWEPAAGVERIGFTLLANILVAIGFGLLLSGGFALRQLLSGAEPSPALRERVPREARRVRVRLRRPSPSQPVGWAPRFPAVRARGFKQVPATTGCGTPVVEGRLSGNPRIERTAR